MSNRQLFTIQSFKNYVYNRCKTHCRNTNESATFVDYLINHREDWDCFLCKTNLIEILYQNNIYMNNNTIVDHYHIYDEGKGPIRALLCKSCNIKEGKIYADIKLGISYVQLLNKYEIKYGKQFLNNIELYYNERGGMWPMDTSED